MAEVPPKQLSRLTGIPAKTLASWRARNYGPPFLAIGGRIYYDVDDYRAWRIAQKRVPGKRR